MSWKVIEGDVNEFLLWLDASSFDACLADPPYGLSDDPRPYNSATPRKSSRERIRAGFMGMKWDAAVPGPEVWAEALRVLKPGAHALIFGAPRTEHRLACAIEDSGFEIRDKFCWLFGSGMPKSLDLSKSLDKAAGAERRVAGKSDSRSIHDGAKRSDVPSKSGGYGYETKGALPVTSPATDAAKLWSGYGTGIKPSYESAILAMKPCEGTFAGNALKWGVAGLAVDRCRIGTDVVGWEGAAAGGNTWNEDNSGLCKPGEARPVAGRWPSNLLLSCACDGEHEPGCPARMLDEQSGITCSRRHSTKRSATTEISGQQYCGGYSGQNDVTIGFGDLGGASRFFFCAKSSTFEREAGLIGHLPCATCGGLDTAHHLNDKGDQVLCRRNDHPTQKPLKLCEYLARLLLPPKRDTPRRILVPFAGAGSEMIGALKAGWDEVIGIEIDHHYCQIAEARLSAHNQT
jgi:site-specific DNA-methyltransferase (adenine-specific)